MTHVPMHSKNLFSNNAELGGYDVTEVNLHS